MKSRHRSREIALQILYQHDLIAHSSGQRMPEAHQIIEGLKYHFDYFAVDPELREFSAELVAGTLSRLSELDPLLEKQASHWKVSRMSSVDRCLLRMALFEMLFIQDTPRSVVIDEAVELAKQFGTEDTPSFINAILDHISVPAEKIPVAAHSSS
ncbi:MAG: transcription antitermination factor NusB [Bdellovibrionia bacterium]